MINKFTKRILICLFAFAVMAQMVSCSSTKKIKYFQDIPDSGAITSVPHVEYQEPKIQTDDILTVLVYTVDPAATAVVNSGNIASSNGGTMVGTQLGPNQATSGFLVDKEGNIDMPVIGKVAVAGLTTNQAKSAIRDKAVKQYTNPTVIIRYANFKISVTGEVNKPGTYIMPNEKVTILDALATAGDLSIYGKRENVLLIRESADKGKEMVRLNLKKSDLISSPYFYLKQNDIVYVEPNSAKAAANDVTQARTYTILGSLLSVLIVLFTRR